ncbi:MAG: DUF58 domain-containing protein [Planctomycetota bacterium]|nr:DUF58 domain-containing protein [Planctomycetota bacterium]
MFVLPAVRLDTSSGGHRTPHAGEGVDFLDFRPYTPGDDFRRIDWNLYGRLRQLFVRLNEASRQLCVSLLLDSSKSMLFGHPVSKLHQAQSVACALGFIALKNGDRVNVMNFADGVKGALGPLTGIRSLPSLVRFMQQVQPGGSSDLGSAAKRLRSMRQHKGLVVVLSDFLNVCQCEEAISVVLSGGGKVLAIQILDPLDRGTGLKGNLRLRDCETGRLVDVRINDDIRAVYQKQFEARRRQFEDYCLERQQLYIQALTTDNYLELICSALRSKAVIR